MLPKRNWYITITDGEYSSLRAFVKAIWLTSDITAMNRMPIPSQNKGPVWVVVYVTIQRPAMAMNTPRMFSLEKLSLKMSIPTIIEKIGLVAMMRDVIVGDSVNLRPYVSARK